MNFLGQIGFCFALLLIIGIPAYLWESRAKRRKTEAAFADREKLNTEMCYEKYLQSEGIAPEIDYKIKDILANELGVDSSRLEASDDFSKNLKFFWDYASIAKVAMVLRLEEEFHIAITNEEAEQTRRVADLVKLVGEKVQRQNV